MIQMKALRADLLKCIKFAGIVSGIIIAISSVIGLIRNGFNLIGVLESIKGALFIVGGLGLIITAVALLMKTRKSQEGLNEEWKKKFSCISYRVGIGVVSAVIIICGCIVDSILFQLYM